MRLPAAGLMLAVAGGLVTVAATPRAEACACCTNAGQRNVAIAKLDSSRREMIDRVRFSADAVLYTGERDPADIQGVAPAASDYSLHVTQEPGRWMFAFRDKSGNAGELSLVLPQSLSIFEVDPRMGEPEGGTGPALYKEWMLVAARATGTGIFADGLRDAAARVTLILHGRGNSCTSTEDFSHWTLQVQGPKASYAFIGELMQ